MNPALLTIPDLASRWQVSVKHVRTLAVRAGIPVIKVGNRVRFRLQDVERWEQTASERAEKIGRVVWGRR